MSHSLREVWSPFRSPVRNGECPEWNVTEMPPCAHYTGGAREESTEQIDALIPFLAIKFVHVKTCIFSCLILVGFLYTFHSLQESKVITVKGMRRDWEKGDLGLNFSSATGCLGDYEAPDFSGPHFPNLCIHWPLHLKVCINLLFLPFFLRILELEPFLLPLAPSSLIVVSKCFLNTDVDR